MKPFAESILKVIAYFDVFDYPVKQEEIKLFLDQPVDDAEIYTILQQLAEEKIIHRFKKFYLLKNNPSLIEKRITGNEYAIKRLKLANKVARLMTWFPYIRGIAISGSLSKNFACKGSDLDFFLITAANRLWISRLQLHILNKTAKVFGLQSWFCINYFIDETALEIEEKNIFTAMEILTLLPVTGSHIFNQFFDANTWAYHYFPACTPRNTASKKILTGILKRFFEWLLNNKLGDRIDKNLFLFFKRRWAGISAKKRMTLPPEKNGELAVGRHFCKPYPKFFQKKVLSRFNENISKIRHLREPVNKQ